MMLRSTRAAFGWLFPANAEPAERFLRWSQLAVTAMAVTVLVLLFAGATGLLRVFPPGPVSAIVGFYENGNAGEYDRALGYLSSSARTQALRLGTDGWRAAVDGVTRERSITDVKPLTTRFIDNHVVALVSIVYTDGDELLSVERVTEEGREWKLEWPDELEDRNGGVQDAPDRIQR